MNKKSNIIIYYLLSLLTAAALMLYTTIGSSINRNIEYSLKSFYPASKVDSTILLITIDDSDIEQLGGWPLKRSYYALLINKLNQMNVKAIGIEVFLSDLISSQSVYSDVLKEQANISNNIVFGSIINDIKSTDDLFLSDSINLPFLAKFNNIKTGHLSYIKGSSGILLPLFIMKDSKVEKAFSLSLANFYGIKLQDRNHININFEKSWESYSKYSLIEFFNLFENSNEPLHLFKNKTVIVGITAQSLAKSVHTVYDEQLPGIGFHASALDNILNNNFYNDSFFSVSTIILFFISVVPLFINRKRLLLSILILISFLAASYLSLNVFKVYLDFSAFVIPFILVSSVQLILYVIMSNSKRELTLKENKTINKELSDKTSQLKRLENELELGSADSSNELLEKVTKLKQEVIELRNISRDTETAESVSINEETNFHGIIFKSKGMLEVVSTIKKVSKENATILIQGESGSGKELVAKAIHKLSKRNGNNFVAVNCAALSETLLESELFGHVKGSFTNAVSDKKGLFEEADNGTIFLDEIGETSETFQTKLLRVLQSGEIQKVGSTKTIKVDCRIIAATNKNLISLVESKKFREDLYYRINVIQISIPPLRERKEDIQFIVNHFLKNEDAELSLSKAVLDILVDNEWKGNVRELESVIKRAAIYSKSENRKVVQIKDLPLELAKINKSSLDDLILNSLSEKNFSHSSINETASDLSISRTVVSENLRGILFKNYVNANFESDLAIIQITKDFDAVEKLKQKLDKYLSNIKKDLDQLKVKDFDLIKNEFSSKYKNLPQKYHLYLDEIIKNFLKNN